MRRVACVLGFWLLACQSARADRYGVDEAVASQDPLSLEALAVLAVIIIGYLLHANSKSHTRAIRAEFELDRIKNASRSEQGARPTTLDEFEKAYQSVVAQGDSKAIASARRIHAMYLDGELSEDEFHQALERTLGPTKPSK